MSFKEKIAFNLAHWSKQPRPARSAAAHLLAKSGLAEWFSYRRNGMVIRMRSGGLARLLWADPGKRLDGELFISRFLKNADVVVDVGANIGILTHLASIMVGCRGMVMAIEAHPRTHEALLENLRLNRLTNVVPMNCAVGRENGAVRFSDRIDDDWNKVDGTNGSIEVAQRRLDDLCAPCAQIDLMKIDVEGYELPVLEGAASILMRTRCVLLECWETHTEAFGYRPKDLIEFMEGHSFRGFALAERDCEVVLTSISARHVQRELENYVFVRDADALSRAGIVVAEER